MAQIQDVLRMAGESSCLALDYVYSTLNPALSEFEKNMAVVAGILSAREAGVVGDDFFVKDAAKLLNFIDGKTYKVEKKDITTFKDLIGTKKACVRFDKDGHSHWVYAANGKIVWDSLAKSQCRWYGKPTTARIITEVKKEDNKEEK